MKEFSGGMKRRLEIARGLLHHPKIIFLDEPTFGLDPQTRNHMWTYLKELNKNEGTTIFFTTIGVYLFLRNRKNLKQL